MAAAGEEAASKRDTSFEFPQLQPDGSISGRAVRDTDMLTSSPESNSRAEGNGEQDRRGRVQEHSLRDGDRGDVSCHLEALFWTFSEIGVSISDVI